MRTILIMMNFALFIAANSSGQTNFEYKIEYAGAKICISTIDTICIKLEKQSLIAIRYAFQNYDSVDCYILTQMPDAKNLKGEDFFYNFAASFMTRSFICSAMTLEVLTNPDPDETPSNFDKSRMDSLEVVWADIEGLWTNVMQRVIPVQIINYHDNYGKIKEGYYDNQSFDKILLQKFGLKVRPEGGWLHFSYRSIKK